MKTPLVPSRRSKRLFYKKFLKGVDAWRGFSIMSFDVISEYQIVEAQRIISYVYEAFGVLPFKASPIGSYGIQLGYRLKVNDYANFDIEASTVFVRVGHSILNQNECGAVGSAEVLEKLEHMHKSMGFENDKKFT